MADARVPVLLALLALPLSGCVGAEVVPSPYDLVLEEARRVAEALDTPAEAIAAGYEPERYCIPQMGVHWVHRPGRADSFLDASLDPRHPEVLLFLPDTGDMSDVRGDRFLGLEFVVVTEGTPMNATDALPTLHGVRLQGPMPGHAPGMPWHAELHVYLAEGMVSDESFRPQNPAVVCPAGTTPPQDGAGAVKAR